jgi:hypothetical protein
MSRIPGRYLEDFREQQLEFTKSRVRLLCFLTVLVYFALSILDFAFNRNEHIFLEIMAGSALAMAGLLTLFLEDRTKSLRATKGVAFLFVVVLVGIMVRLGITYYDSPATSSAAYVFTMLIVVMTVPWGAKEVIPLGIIHLAGFIVENLYIARLNNVSPSGDYASGIIFIAVAFLLCVILRKKETERDIDNFVLLKTVEAKNAQMKKDLELATRVHKTIIPNGIDTDLVSINVTYLPAYYVGGDYTSYVFLPGDKITFIISDVTGHGVSAALLVNRMHAEFERIAKEGKEPGELMRDLNVFINSDFQGSDMYLTAFCGQLDMKKMTLYYSSYAHPPQYLYDSKTGNLRSMSSMAGMLGISSTETAIFQNELQIGVGDRILLYTDGVTETFNSSGEQFGNIRLERFFLANHLLVAKQLDGKLISKLNSFKSGKFRDDICMLDIVIRAHSSFFSHNVV